MTPLHRLEHMLDALGIDATGLERAPEYERAELPKILSKTEKERV